MWERPRELSRPRTPRQSTGGAYIRWFKNLSRSDTPDVGGKGANLGEMTQAGLPVPPGFVVTVRAYRRYDEASGLAAEVTARMGRPELDDPDRLLETAEAMQPGKLLGERLRLCGEGFHHFVGEGGTSWGINIGLVQKRPSELVPHLACGSL